MTCMHGGRKRPSWLLALVSAAVSLMLVLFASNAPGLVTESSRVALTTTVRPANIAYDRGTQHPFEVQREARLGVYGRPVAGRTEPQSGPSGFVATTVVAADTAATGVRALEGGTLQDVGGAIWANGNPAALVGTRTGAALRGLASRADAVKLRDFYQAAADAGRGGGTAPERVKLAQEIIDAWK